MHVGLDHDGLLPSFLTIVTDGKTADITAARALRLPKASIMVMDWGYTDDAWHHPLHTQGLFFVSPDCASVAATASPNVAQWAKPQGLISDQTLGLTGTHAELCRIRLRRIGFRDPETDQHYAFLTNQFGLAAATIAQIYKARWQIVLFFKWIKQNLGIKTFLGNTRSAVMTQVWFAICVYLLLAHLKFVS